MKSLIIIPKYKLINEKNYEYYMPIGLGYIMSTLKKYGYQYDCLNLNHLEGLAKDNISKYLEGKKYDFVLTGGMAIEYWQIKSVIDSLKDFDKNLKIILGGLIITTEPEVMFEEFKSEFGIMGDGEETIIELFKCLENNGDLSKVDDLIYRENNKVVINKKRVPNPDLDLLPFPDYESLGYDEYLDNNCDYQVFFSVLEEYPRLFVILGSRSCPFQCSFCYHYNNYRQRSVDNIMEEIELAVKKYNVNIINVVDECLSVKKERLLEFCDKMTKLRKKLGKDLKWQALLRVDIVEDDILKLMKSAGCFAISLGFESYSPVVLKSMRKQITPELIDKALKLVFDNKIISGGAAFIFGDIAETMETANETLEFWKNKCKGQVFLSFVMPYPNSEIYQYCLRNGIIEDKLKYIKSIDNLLISGVYKNMTKLSDKEFEELRGKVLYYLEKYRYVSKPISVKKNKEKYTMEAKCPFCGEINKFSNLKINNRFLFGFYVFCNQCFMKYHIYNITKRLFFKHYKVFKDLKAVKDKLVINSRKR